MTETTDTGSVRITLADIWAQGQETQKRVTAVENKVDDLTTVNLRLAKHSERIDICETDIAILKQAVAVLTQSLKTEVAVRDGKLKAVDAQAGFTSRLLWWVLGLGAPSIVALALAQLTT
jgi:hypothetical protein